MNIDALISEGEKLSRPCVILHEGLLNEQTVGFWGGRGVPPSLTEHWISIDCIWLKHIGINISGSISVFHDSKTDKWLVSNDQKVGFREKVVNGIPLNGMVSTSFPPLEALCLYGGDEIEKWLQSLGKLRTDFNELHNSEIGKAYNREFQRRCPLYTGQVDAVIGGWHMMWPESNSYDEHGLQMYLWTFRDAEPWIEVWPQNNELKAVDRIT